VLNSTNKITSVKKMYHQDLFSLSEWRANMQYFKGELFFTMEYYSVLILNKVTGMTTTAKMIVSDITPITINENLA